MLPDILNHTELLTLTTENPNGSSLLAFRVGPYHFCAPAVATEGIVPVPRLHSLPLARAEVSGFCLFRGETALVINLRRKLGLPDNTGEGKELLLVTRLDNHLVAFQVDEALDVLMENTLVSDRIPAIWPGFGAKTFFLHGDLIFLKTSYPELFGMACPPQASLFQNKEPITEVSQKPPAAGLTLPLTKRTDPPRVVPIAGPRLPSQPKPRSQELPRSGPRRISPPLRAGPLPPPRSAPAPFRRPPPMVTPHNPRRKFPATTPSSTPAGASKPFRCDPKRRRPWPLLAFLGAALMSLVLWLDFAPIEAGITAPTSAPSLTITRAPANSAFVPRCPPEPDPAAAAATPALPPDVIAAPEMKLVPESISVPAALPHRASQPLPARNRWQTRAEAPSKGADPRPSTASGTVSVNLASQRFRFETGDFILTVEPSLSFAPSGPRIGAQASAAIPAESAGAEEFTHIVVRGDTLWSIARDYLRDPLRYPELAKLSRIANPDLIYPGDRIRIQKKIPSGRPLQNNTRTGGG
ncbi:MAG: chemotaxis protein CheW [Deltaproteobacteria bacterium]|nr:chemotaxis protein CheW [Deltaproteobacteria bacterium]